jgi:hypothetical protein
MSEFVPDSIVQTIIERFRSRAEFGYNKYQTNLDRTDLSPDQWAQHALEEMHDSMLYIQKWKQEQEKQKKLLDLLMQMFCTFNNTVDNVNHNELPELIEWYKQHNNL